MIGPRVGFDRLTRSIEVEIANRIGSNWDEWVGLMRRFQAREGHCDVPQRHREGKLRLGQWVSVQRNTKGTMSVERRHRLDAIGFIWDVPETRWDEEFAALKQFKAREGHCNAPQGHREGILPLGNWVSMQRTNKNTMSTERKHRLDEIGFIWDPYESEWENGFSALEKFKEREGHCAVPRLHREGTLSLGNWVSNQRARKDTKLSDEHRQRLDEIGFVWNAREANWEKGFAALEKFKVREGHCNVPTELLLGRWVVTQRTTKDKMSNERRQRLDKIGFVWDTIETKWEDNGHCNVHPSHVEGSYRLGAWVLKQRWKKDTMSNERRKRLNEIGFNWDAREAKWEDGFSALKQFKIREGHCNVPAAYREGTYRFGAWVNNQRFKDTKMSIERRQRLDKIGFVWAKKHSKQLI
jgi:Helicase associated domain